MLVSGVGLVLSAILVWFGLIAPLIAAGANVGSRVAGAERDLEIAQRLRRDYDEIHQRLSTVEERIQTGPRGNLRTTLESLAQRASVKIDSMEPQAAPAGDRYRETKVEVALKQVSLPQTVRYLHEIESTEELLSVKALRIRTRPDQPELLDVSFTVSSFEPI
jgi:general secretion pathway protein M